MNIQLENSGNNWKKISLSDHSGWEYDSDSKESESSTDSKEPARPINMRPNDLLPNDLRPNAKGEVKLTKFDPNEMLFSKWAENYYSEMKSGNRTEREIIDGLVGLMPTDMRSAIAVFPKDCPWLYYRKSIQELFLNQSYKLLTKRPYADYQNFSEFFADKLRLLDDLEMANETRKNIIYRILDDQFKSDVELQRINEMQLHEFGLACIRVEKSLGLKCTNCQAATHATNECRKRAPRVEFALDDTFWTMVKKSFINLRRMRASELVAVAFWFVVVVVALIGIVAMIQTAIISLRQAYYPSCTCSPPESALANDALTSLLAKLESATESAKKFLLERLDFGLF